MDLLIKQARIDNTDKLYDFAIEDGKIVDVQEKIDGKPAQTINADGRVLIPGLIESHIHLDKALIADRKPNKSGTLQEALKVTASLKPTFSTEDIYERAKKTVMEMLVPNGVTTIRTHAEFDPAQGFSGFDVVMGLKEELKDYIELQVVAFPQEGIFKSPGTVKMMEEALEKGADVVGGIPYNDRDANEHIDYVLDLAIKHDLPLDLHQDFADDADKLSIEYLCEQVIAKNYQGKVSVGHLTAIAALEAKEMDRIINLISKAGISVMSLPATDLHLGGRNDDHNVRRTLTPISKLRDAGVNVCIATNNIRNAFTPYGTGDIMQTAMLAIAAGHLGGADDLPTVLDMITKNPAKALGLKDYGVEKGDKADLVLLDTKSFTNAVIDQATKLYVIKNGLITVRNTKTTVVEKL